MLPQPGAILEGWLQVGDVIAQPGGAPVLSGRALQGEPSAVRMVLLHRLPASSEVPQELIRAARVGVGIRGLVQPAAIELPDSSGQEGRQWLLIYRYEAGEPMTDRPATSSGPWPQQVARQIGDVAAVLRHLHEQGVAHGFLHPSLMWRPVRAPIQLGGLGVAELLCRTGGPECLSEALPAAWRPPELQAGRAQRPQTWTDVYAVGALAVRLLCGDAQASPEQLQSALGRRLAQHLLAARAWSPAGRVTDLMSWADELSTLCAEHSEPSPPLAVPVAATEGQAPSASPLLPAPASAPLEPPRPAVPLQPPLDTGLAAPDRSSSPPSPSPSPSPSQSLPAERSEPPPQAGERVAEPPVEPRVAASPPAKAVASPRSRWWVVLPLTAAALLFGATAVLAVVWRAQSVTQPAGASGMPPAGTAWSVAAGGAPSKLPMQEQLTEPPSSSERPPPPLPPTSGAVLESETVAPIPLSPAAPVWGRAGARATVVVFGDVTCPHTRRAYRLLRALKLRLGERLRLLWYNRVHSERQQSVEAARLLRRASVGSGSTAAWQMLDALLIESKAHEPSGLTDGAPTVAAPDDAAVQALAKLESSLAGQFRIRSTPTLFVNGRRVVGVPEPDLLEGIVSQELAHAVSLWAAGVPRAELYARRVDKNLIGLGPNPYERIWVPISGSPARGAAKPLVTVVQFSDYECSYCLEMEPTLQELRERFPDAVRLVYKHLPLDTHPKARLAANLAHEALRMAGEAGFWKLHDRLHAPGAALSDEALGKAAQAAGLDAVRALAQARLGKHDGAIDADQQLANRIKVHGIPTFFVNGRRLEGVQTFKQLTAVIQEELVASRRLLAEEGAAQIALYREASGALPEP